MATGANQAEIDRVFFLARLGCTVGIDQATDQVNGSIGNSDAHLSAVVTTVQGFLGYGSITQFDVAIG
ncbi:hypothetical protein D3C79_740850 [compost metagenome]